MKNCELDFSLQKILPNFSKEFQALFYERQYGDNTGFLLA